MQYDAIEQPDPAIWLELDETERVDVVIEYHRRIGVQLETPELHATAHVVVENQVALGEVTPVPETLDRLMDEGLDRHGAKSPIATTRAAFIRTSSAARPLNSWTSFAPYRSSIKTFFPGVKPDSFKP
jgi:hypothetical protein